MRQSRVVLRLMLADFIVRSAYQMGKTPLLPIFAASLGASGSFLGLIVSVSTVTGLVLKPLFGLLSDRWGRRLWLLLGTALFAGLPFLYRFVLEPEQLVALRLLHGLATAIYGPVTLAVIADVARCSAGQQSLAEAIGWFEMARSGGYIAGPALAGALLLGMEPGAVFTVIGLLSCLAFLPLLRLPETAPRAPMRRQALAPQLHSALQAGARSLAVWQAGGLEAGVFIVLYTLKAFLPLAALEAGVNVALVGAFFSLNEALHVLCKPACGRLSDRLGYGRAISLGLLLFALALPLTWAWAGGLFLLSAALLGLAQALLFPAAKAQLAQSLRAVHMGAGMGLLGMLQNAGKVAGPVLGGLMIAALGYQGALLSMSALLVTLSLSAMLLPLRQRLPSAPARS